MKTYHALYDSYGATLRIEASAPHVARILAAQRMGVPESHRCLIAIVDPDAAGGAGYLARKAKLASWMPPSARDECVYADDFESGADWTPERLAAKKLIAEMALSGRLRVADAALQGRDPGFVYRDEGAVTLDRSEYTAVDTRCQGCTPTPVVAYSVETHTLVLSNPEGWREVDGVYLPSVADWHDKDNELAREGNAWAKLDQNDLDKVHECWVRNGRSE